jgi:uncharacterized protein YcfJ
MKPDLRFALAVAGLALAAQASAQITLFEHEDFAGRSFTTEQRIANFARYGFNDRASSVVVARDRWEACEDAGFNGRCVVLRPGQYPTLRAMGLNNRISSIRIIGAGTRIDADRYAPAPVAAYDWHRREHERLYEANVTAARAVVGPPEQRCWIEREQVVENENQPNVPGAIVGAIVGGVLGHQVGSGRGNDVATVGGAVAGAAVGANVGRDHGGGQVATRDVQRCASVPRHARPDYWDVTYYFRGQEHHVQMTAPPGATITVNGDGEPRA